MVVGQLTFIYEKSNDVINKKRQVHKGTGRMVINRILLSALGGVSISRHTLSVYDHSL